MTQITQAEFRRILGTTVPCNLSAEQFAQRILEAAGITIQQEPSEAMVRLAREIAAGLYPGDEAGIVGGQWDAGAAVKAALAALQHAVDVVKGAKRVGDIAGSGSLIVRADILTALGAA